MPIQPTAASNIPVTSQMPGNDSEFERVVEWRIEWLCKAGWSRVWANTIARMTVEDLVAAGWSRSHAEREGFDFWRKAEKAIRCGSEPTALYLLSLLTERI